MAAPFRIYRLDGGDLIGPGKPLDTDRWHVISANLLGGLPGHDGPSSLDPGDGRVPGFAFPIPPSPTWCGCTAGCSRRIERLAAAIGGSTQRDAGSLWTIDRPAAAGTQVCGSARLSAARWRARRSWPTSASPAAS